MAEYNQIEPATVTDFSFEWKITDYSINQAYSSKLLLDSKHRVVLDLTRGVLDVPDKRQSRGVRLHNLHIYFENVTARDSKKFFKISAETKQGQALTFRPYTQLKRGGNSFSVGSRFLDQRNIGKCVEADVLTIFIDITLKDFAECRQESKLNFEKAISSLLTDKSNSDLKIIVNGHTFYVHKAILAARSPVFLKLISNCQGDTLTTESSSCDIFQDIINFIYANRIKTPSIELTDLAKQYELPDLVKLVESLLNPEKKESVSATLVSQAEETEPLKRIKPIKKGKKKYPRKYNKTDSTEKNKNGQKTETDLLAPKDGQILDKNGNSTTENFFAMFAAYSENSTKQSDQFKQAEKDTICSSEIPNTDKENVDPSNEVKPNDITAPNLVTVSDIETIEGAVVDGGNESESSEFEIISVDVNVENDMDSTDVEIEKICEDGHFSGCTDIESDDSEDTLIVTSSNESADESMDGPNTTVVQIKENSDMEQDETTEVDQIEVIKADSTDIIIEEVTIHEADAADQAAMETVSAQPEADPTQENALEVDLDPQEKVNIDSEMTIETATKEADVDAETDASPESEVGEAPIPKNSAENNSSTVNEAEDSNFDADLSGSQVKAEDTATEIEKDDAPMTAVNANPSKKTPPKRGKKNSKGRGKNHKK